MMHIPEGSLLFNQRLKLFITISKNNRYGISQSIPIPRLQHPIAVHSLRFLLSSLALALGGTGQGAPGRAHLAGAHRAGADFCIESSQIYQNLPHLTCSPVTSQIIAECFWDWAEHSKSPNVKEEAAGKCRDPL